MWLINVSLAVLKIEIFAFYVLKHSFLNILFFVIFVSFLLGTPFLTNFWEKIFWFFSEIFFYFIKKLWFSLFCIWSIFFKLLKTCFLHVLWHFWSFKEKNWFSGGSSVHRSIGPKNAALGTCNFWLYRFHHDIFSICHLILYTVRSLFWQFFWKFSLKIVL